jgi:hypothetical protein
MSFKFKFGSCLIFPLSALFATCKGTSNFCIQVSQSKFTVLKIISRKIFAEFMGFFPKGLNPFKIQTKIKFYLLSGFLIQIMLGI